MKHPILLFSLLLLQAWLAVAWDHVGQVSLDEALESAAYVLVACKSKQRS